MPEKLQHPSALRIALIRIHNPLPKRLIIALRPLQHPIPGHGELRATRRPHLLRGLLYPGKQRLGRPLENLLPHLGVDVRVLAVLVLAARVPVAAKVCVAVLLDEGEAEGAEGVAVGVEGGIGVPGGGEAGFVRVNEGEGGGEGGVVVDYVGEVGH